MIARNNTPKIAVVVGILVVCILSVGATIKKAIIEKKAPEIQKVQIVNYQEILTAIETEKQRYLDSIKNEIKTLKIENEQLLAKANSKPKTIIIKETKNNVVETNQIVRDIQYHPQVQLIKHKSGDLQIIEE